MINGPVWLVHSSGNEATICRMAPVWRKLGGTAIGIFDYPKSGYMRRKEITAIRSACTRAGLTLIPGGMLQAPFANAGDPELYRAHLDEAAHWKQYLGSTMWLMDAGDDCLGASNLDDANGKPLVTDLDVGGAVTAVRMLAAGMERIGVSLLLHGPLLVSSLNPMAAKFNKLVYSVWPKSASLVAYRSDISPPPLPDGCDFPLIGHFEASIDDARARAAAAGWPRFGFYCPAEKAEAVFGAGTVAARAAILPS